MVPARIAAVLAELAPLGERFAAAGHRLYLVGGAVRDLLVGGDGTAGDRTCEWTMPQNAWSASSTSIVSRSRSSGWTR